MIKFDFEKYMDVQGKDLYQDKITNIKETLLKKEEMLDWVDINTCISEKEITDILECSEYIKNNADILLVIGIGGSYLGSAAIINALTPYFKKNKPEILFAGTNLSSSYLSELMEYIKDKEVCVNVISKSGTTLEPSIAFDVIYKELQKKYNNDELKKRIIVTTDKSKGTLRKLVDKYGFKSFIVPDNIGGRYSVLTPVGLLPISVAGIDIKELLDGAKNSNIEKAIEYAIIRDILYRDGKVVESFTIYEPKLYFFTEWLKQLFAETQGKENKGILPISTINSRDLHSLGQFYQEGSKILFETVIGVEKSKDVKLENFDKTLNEINLIALDRVCQAHKNGDVLSNIILMDELNEENLGYLIYFFEIAAAVGGYLLGVNPFDQPGVQEYKKLINEVL